MSNLLDRHWEENEQLMSAPNLQKISFPVQVELLFMSAPEDMVLRASISSTTEANVGGCSNAWGGVM